MFQEERVAYAKDAATKIMRAGKFKPRQKHAFREGEDEGELGGMVIKEGQRDKQELERKGS